MTGTTSATRVAPDTRVLGGLLAAPTPFLFFTGKGGVGKTSCAAATAIALADTGRRVLIVSTDPASNLAEVFDMPPVRGSAPVAVPGVAGLDVVNIDPKAAAAEYRERVVGPYRAVLPASAVASIEEELSGSCTVEVAAFNEFVAIVTSPEISAAYDHVVFDTAPTGHTLRLLSLPAAWTGFLETNTAGVTCVGPVSALGQAQEDYSDSLAALRDPATTTVVLVTRAERASLDEADRAAGELAALDMTHQRLVINGVLAAPESDDGIASARFEREQAVLTDLPESLGRALSIDTVPLLARAPMGVDGLRAALDPSDVSPAPDGAAVWPPLHGRSLADLVDDVAQAGPGIVMTMGKGGVGKTTIAAAIALALADRGLPVTLTTTDPAAHVQQVLPDGPANLTITRIDPGAETAAHTARVLATAGAQLDDAALDLLTEDLRSPCTEEVAVFHAFARTVADAAGRYMIIDTAPTGHTLLLLQSSQSFARQAGRRAADAPEEAATHLFTSLSDAEHTRIVLVALPEATPVHEALELQADLARAGLRPYTWVANSALSATSTTDPVLRARAAQENRWLAEIEAASPRSPVIVPWVPRAPVGRDGLRPLMS
jgi:arsenite-transporting ATPase